MIDYTYDFDNQFFRQITIALAKTLTKTVRWINYFEPMNDTETGRIRVLIPFYTSLTGDERFVFDAFVDDVVDKRVTMNTDQFQRGTITWQGFASRSDEFANPNQYLAQKANINGTLRKIISKVKAVPVVLNYDIEIQLATQNEVDKCSQKIMNLFYNYMFFNIDYFGMKIDAILLLPDDKTIEIVREITMESERKKTIKFSLEVKTYYPIFKIEADDLITCDNDDSINWDSVGVPKPTNDFLESLKNYNSNFGQMNTVGGLSGATDIEGMTAIRSVYWNSFFHEIGRQENIITERDISNYNPANWRKEDFDISPVDPGDSLGNSLNRWTSTQLSGETIYNLEPQNDNDI